MAKFFNPENFTEIFASKYIVRDTVCALKAKVKYNIGEIILVMATGMIFLLIDLSSILKVVP